MKSEYSDILTGLPNLILFHNMIDDLIAQNSEMDRFAIACLSIENLREINETFGYQIGDEAIKYVADYLDNSYFTARIAKEKFAILISDIKSSNYLMETLQTIIRNIRFPSLNNEEPIYISMNAGLAVYPDHGNKVTDLVHNAENALYMAKEKGDEIQFYSEEYREEIINQVHLTNLLQKGLDNDEFTLYFQPEVDLKTNKIIGVEALIRWFLPGKGFISPEKFIPIAEKSNLIYDIELMVFEKALRQKVQWEKEGFKHLELSINLSCKTLESECNFRKLEKILASYKVNCSKIIIEITETVNLHAIKPIEQRLNRLKKLGIKIALDDFGTGFSSLSYLRELPIDIIKIDKSFIRAISDNKKEAIIIKNIITMAHELGYRVVAEGIETHEQYKFLRENCCDRGQGFLLCMPLPVGNLSTLLKVNKYKKVIAV